MRPYSYAERSSFCQNATSKRLFSLMESKQSNLSVAADVTKCKDLLQLADEIGPEICVLKTHIDILEDFTPAVSKSLEALAQKHNFLLFEDRKFADIGNTVFYQYSGGIYHIANWADIINAHIVPGPGIIDGLYKASQKKKAGLLLLAEMSSKGNLATGSYTQKAVEMALSHKEFVIGFISQQKLCDDPGFIYMTPGVQLSTGIDALGQQYSTPHDVLSKGSDILIVGRGIYGASNPGKEAKIYRKEGWDGYLQTLKS